MIKTKREKVAFNSRIRPELQDLIDQSARKLGLPKTKVVQLAMGDFAYKVLGKLPESEAAGKVVRFDHESITDQYLNGYISGVYDFGTLGYYLDIDLPIAEKGD